jgi:hypothetical protein
VTNYDNIAKDLRGHRWLIEAAARAGDVEFFIKLGEAIENLKAIEKWGLEDHKKGSNE